MWRTRKKASTSNLYDSLRPRQAEDWASSSHERVLTTARKRKVSHSSRSNHNARMQRSIPCDWNSVAQEIETVVFGESDDDDDDDDDEYDKAFRRHQRRRRDVRGSRPSHSIRSNRLKRQRRNSTSQQSTPRRRAPSTHFAYNLFDVPQSHRPRTAESQTSVIYGPKYRNSPDSLFWFILILLSVLSIALLIIRIATNLLTSGAGTAIVIVMTTCCWYKTVTQPILVGRLLQSSPILFWVVFGAAVCALYSFSRRHSASTLCIGTASCNNGDDGTYNDFVLLWGLVRGAFYGLEVGSVWLIVFGDRLNPSRFTRGLFLCISRPLQEFFKMTRDGNTFELQNDKSQKHNLCAICLDSIPQEQDVSCLLLPCSHYFHEECARHWLKIRDTCPVCRVPASGMQPSCKEMQQ